MLPEAWSRLAAEQFGLLTRAQATALGVTKHEIERLREKGAWEIVHPAVFRVAGSSRAWPHDQMAAWLWAKQNAAVSHRAAARLWDFDAYRADDSVELITRHVLSPPVGITVHRSRKLLQSEVCDLQGMKVTTVARTLFDLYLVDEKSGERTIDEALRRGLVKPNELQHIVGRNRRKGMKGSVSFSALVDEREEGGETGSGLETDTLRLIRSAGLAAPHKQFRVQLATRWAQLDLAWPQQKVCVQVHGGTIHRQRKVWDDDQRLENALRAAKWTVIIATEKIIEEHPDELLGELKDALAGEPKK